ncbi:C4-dicarboxylate-binding periplasmic protein precursor [Pelagimonas phthalicica]|uniref:C4-dicarboxylate-binding periplasmic protein n=1 Tax=Pelagimonas phthalicica TaxID=1037362 RepID=A0A238J9Q5_9RHOB|nr:TRAP transporter substrate-binding protein DctP [Pelagimonas phthalicica]TDS94865.1 TRAP-type C4-dicarboxylate transport system substrate-binding protein [Pelagimonas phthalicica]SMX26606.1 C4-dicarboxylate-binding periplasmic protein precursor [Pelagimonas phthalicica]
MIFKTLSSIAASAVLATGTMLAATGTAQADERFTLAHAMPPEHIFHPTSEKFMEALGEGFEVEYHPGGDLGDWTSLFEQAMQGAVPMTMTFAATEFDPRLNIFAAGYIVDSWEQARKMYGPNGAMIPVYDEILSDLDMKLVGVLPVDFGGYAIRKGVGAVPLDLPAEGNGIKVRVPGLEIAIKRYELLGFSPVPMPFAELYTALQLGTVDGRTFGPPPEIWQMRDVLETYVYSKDYFEHAYWLVNKSWWDDLSDEDRAKMQTAVDTAVSWAWDEAKTISDKTLEDIRGAGINVVEFNDEQLAAVKKIVYEQEWPFLEKIVGPETTAALKAAAGVE